MFYNTGIYTYVWIISNKKPDTRKGKVQLIDGTQHYQKMSKSLGNKRNELSAAHIDELTRLYAEHQHNAVSEFLNEGKTQQKVCSKLFNNQDFAYLKITVERPLRLNFMASPERIAKLDEQSAFVSLASSLKRKDEQAQLADINAGQQQQASIKAALCTLNATVLWQDRAAFLPVLEKALKPLDFKIAAPVKKAILEALSERDPQAEICRDNKGNPEADAHLRDTELVPLPNNMTLPLPLDYDNETGLDALLNLVRPHCERYLRAEVLPHVPDAWIDYSKTKVGYEIPLNRHFYVYEPPRPLELIASEIKTLEQEIMEMLGGITE
jgi:type I restriction enzyme M protein